MDVNPTPWVFVRPCRHLASKPLWLRWKLRTASGKDKVKGKSKVNDSMTPQIWNFGGQMKRLAFIEAMNCRKC